MPRATPNRTTPSSSRPAQAARNPARAPRPSAPRSPPSDDAARAPARATPVRVEVAQVVRSKGRKAWEPSDDEIRLRAFQVFQRRGGYPGSPEGDWEQARRELVEERAALARPA